MKPFQAVLFDFDNVIAHTTPIMKQALWRFFRERELKVLETDFDNDGYATKSLLQVCEILAGKYDIHLDVDTLRTNIWQTQITLFEEGLESDSTLIPFLEYCQQSDIKVAIGSNSFRSRVEWVIKKMGIDKYFLDTTADRGYRIIGAGDITHHKPDPEVWMKCSEILEIPLSESLVIEDGFPGLTGAKQCGARGIYYHRFCKPEKACMELAEKSVENFSELF